MLYRSTRDFRLGADGTSDGAERLTFEQCVLRGLAEDGGLLVPETIPRLTVIMDQSLSFQQWAYYIFRCFIGSDSVDDDQQLLDLIHRSYKTFNHPEVTPCIPLLNRGSDHEQCRLYLLELYHGPTLAFKDVALQLVGNLFEYFLANRGSEEDRILDSRPLTVVGATSGDTGSAAIYGLRGKRNVRVFILHPAGRVSPIQEAQMTTVMDENIQNIAVLQSTFDDCQSIVKQLFNDRQFSAQYRLGAVNSINWARIMAQIVYYFFSYQQTIKLAGLPMGTRVSFAVPTGNFGDVLAGYYAKCMGLPVGRLLIATNANDILVRFLETGVYSRQKIAIETVAPAMDIQISSNFERLLFHACCEYFDGNQRKAAQQIHDWMRELQSPATQQFQVPSAVLAIIRRDFDAYRCDDSQIQQTIRHVHECYGVVVDPHTATAIHAASDGFAGNPSANSSHGHPSEEPVICLATAHPAKFLQCVYDSLVPAEEADCGAAATETASEATGEQIHHRLERDVLNGKRSDCLFSVPPSLHGLLDLPRKCLTSANSAESIKKIILS